MNLRIQKNYYFLFAVLMVFIAALACRVWYIEQKDALHVDEVFTVKTANNSPMTTQYNYAEKHFYTGAQLKQKLLWNDDSKMDFINDIKALQLNNADNKEHTNLYYLLLRTWCFGENSWDIKGFIAKGCSLNLLFFAVSFLLLFKIMRKIFPAADGNILIITGLVVAFLNTGSLSLSSLIRSYQLQQTAFLVVAYVFVVLFMKIKEEQKDFRFGPKYLFVFTAASALAFLCEYASIALVIMLSSVLAAEAFKYKNVRVIWLLVAGILGAFAICLLVQQDYLNVLRSPVLNVGVIEGKNRADLWSELLKLFENSIYFYGHFLFYVPVAVVAIYLLSRRGFGRAGSKGVGNNNDIALILVAVVFIWAEMILFFAPYKVLRYFAASFPLLALGVPVLLSFVKGKERLVVALVLMFIYGANALTAESCENTDNFTAEPKPSFVKKVLTPAKIENLFTGKRERYAVFTDYPDAPVLLCWPHNMAGVYANTIPYFNDEQRYMFIFDSKIPKLKTSKMFVLFTKDCRADLKSFGLMREMTLSDLGSYKIWAAEMVRK